MSKIRNPLNKKHQVRTRREFIDYDYADKLSEEELKFLKKFTDEYYGGGGFTKDCKGKYEYHKCTHKNDNERRECYKRNSRQNKDIYNLLRISNKLENIEDCITKDKIKEYEEFLSLMELEENIRILQELGYEADDGKKNSDKPKCSLNKS